MNWVGGSRNRILFKHERQKQKEFFEKKKLKSKLKLLQTPSPNKEALSLDLLNLFVVNQISNKKKKNNKPKHVDICKAASFGGKDNAELPMSPITFPSRICLDDSEIKLSGIPTTEYEMIPNTPDPSNKESIHEEERDIITYVTRGGNIATQFSMEQTEMKAGAQQYMYDKFAKDNRVRQPEEDIGEVKEIMLNSLSLQHADLNVIEFAEQDDWSQNNQDLFKNVKHDVSVQCTFTE